MKPDRSPASQSPAPTRSAVVAPVKRRRWLPAVAIALLLVAVSLGVWQWQSRQDSPDAVFRAAIAQALSTGTVTQAITSQGSTETIKYDLSNVHDPRLSITTPDTINAVNVQLQAYGNSKSSYFTISRVEGSSQALSQVLNKWVALRQNGKTIDGADPQLVQLADPAANVLGEFIFGNFSATDRARLTDFAVQQQIYHYDPTQVRHGTLNGQSVMIYSITLNSTELKAFNQQAAAMLGLGRADTAAALDSINQLGNLSAKLYIATATKHVIKVSAKIDGQATTITYSAYGRTKLPPEPKADLTWQQFQTLLSAPAAPAPAASTI